MATRKFTIELSEQTIAVIERLKLDEVTIEEAIPRFVDMGIMEAISSGGNTNPLSTLMDRIMSRFRGDSKGPDISGGPETSIKMMRIDENGEPVEVDIADLPEEISAYIAEMEAAVKEGLRNGKSMHEIMDGLGATACSSMGEVMERAGRPKTEIISDGNVIHFPTTKLS